MDTKKALRVSMLGQALSENLTQLFFEKDQQDMDRVYRTTDLSLAAALRTALSSTPTVHISDRLAEFHFQVNPESAKRLAQEFYGDRLSVNPRRYSEDLRTLKAMIFQARGQAN